MLNSRILARLVLFGLIALCVLAVPIGLIAEAGTAWAQATAPAADSGTTFSLGSMFSDVRGTLENLIGIAIGAIVGFLFLRLNKSTGISIDEKYRTALQSALQNGVHAGFDLLGNKLDDVTFDVKSELLAKVIRYAKTFAPDAIAHFKLSDTDLEEMAKAQLAKLLPSGTTMAPSTPAAPAI